VAEGQARNSTGEFLQFLGMANGSLAEMITQAELAGRLGYLPPPHLEKIDLLATEISRMLTGLKRSLRLRKLNAEN
jgi:four helix bundle protein